MTYGRNKVLFNSSAMTLGVAPLRNGVRPRLDDSEELAALRSINAQLTRELAQLKVREAQAQRLADRDGLTGLYNRRRMSELLDSAIADAARQWQCVSLLFIDLNGFKAINDEYGHAAAGKSGQRACCAALPTPRR
jgi:PleD family two-component response regulator